MRVDERVTAELKGVLVRDLGATPPQHQLEVPYPHAGIEPDSQNAAATEAERLVGAPLGIREDEQAAKSLAVLIAGQRFWWRERNHDHARPEFVGVVKHLDQVLAAWESGQVAQEDDQRLLASQRRQRHGASLRVGEREVGEPVARSERHLSREVCARARASRFMPRA